MNTLLQILGLRSSPIREGILGIDKKKHRKKKTSTDSTTTAAAPVSCDPPTLDANNDIYNSQLATYSSTISGLNSQVSNLSGELAQYKIDLSNEEKSCKIELSEQQKRYLSELKLQKKNYEKQIADLEEQIRKDKNIITDDTNTIKNNEDEIAILKEELNIARQNKDKCIQESIAAGFRFANNNANTEANVYNSELDGIFKDIDQEMDTMQTQNLYAYTLKDHIQKVKKDIGIVNKQINAYKDKIHLNQRKSFYEQQEVNMEEGWEIGLHIVYASIFIGIIIYLCITKDPALQTPKIMNPVNIIIVVCILLYPMIIYPISKSAYDTIKYLFNQMPKDMYMHI